ncbi:hypothetical protein D9M71_530200 [compost metagenome]
MGRVQVQQPIVAFGTDQRTVGGDIAGHPGNRQLREQFQPFQRQARGRLRGGQWLGRRRVNFVGMLDGQLIQITVAGRVHFWLVIVFVQRRLVVAIHAGRAVTNTVVVRGQVLWRNLLNRRRHRRLYGNRRGLDFRFAGDRIVPGQVDNRLRRRGLDRLGYTFRRWLWFGNRFRLGNHWRWRRNRCNSHDRRSLGGGCHRACRISCGLADPHRL